MFYVSPLRFNSTILIDGQTYYLSGIKLIKLILQLTLSNLLDFNKGIYVEIVFMFLDAIAILDWGKRVSK